MAKLTRTYGRYVMAVDDEPYCIWDCEMDQKNLDFLNQYDTDYFQFIAEMGINSIPEDDSSEDKSHLKVAFFLRQNLHQSLEAMFSLLCALVQSPSCVYAWLLRYQNIDLKNVISKIQRSDKEIKTLLNLKPVSWEGLARIIFSTSNPDAEEVEKNIKNFSELWERLAEFYLNDDFKLEYNSIKHGFRARSGGFGFAYGMQTEPSVPAPPEAMRMDFTRSVRQIIMSKTERSKSDEGYQIYGRV